MKNPIDGEKRRTFCHWFYNHGANFSDHILYTDEAEFKGNGTNHNFTLNVWCGVVGTRLIGPYFLSPKLNGKEYLKFLKEKLLPVLSIEQRECMWFLHDGAPPHQCQEVQQLLNSTFPNRWIGKGGKEPWPPQSPDLNPIDFYVWKHIKETIDDRKEIKTCEEYKAQITSAFESFRNDSNHFEMISTTMDHTVLLCIRENGGYFKAPNRNFFRNANKFKFINSGFGRRQ